MRKVKVFSAVGRYYHKEYEIQDFYIPYSDDEINKGLGKYPKEVPTYNIINTESVDIKNIKKVFISQNAILPRVLLKNYSHVKTTRAWQNSEYVVCSISDINHVTRNCQSKYYGLSLVSLSGIQEFLQLVQLRHIVIPWQHRLNMATKICLNVENKVTSEMLNENGQFYMSSYILSDLLSGIDEDDPNLHPVIKDLIISQNDRFCQSYYDEQEKLSFDVITNKPIILDIDFAKMLGLNIIDGEQFEQIDKLMSSKDKTNFELGYSILTSCDYTVNTHLICELINRYRGHLRESKFRTTVIQKRFYQAFREFVISSTTTSLITVLKRLDVIENNIKYINEHAKEEIIIRCGYNLAPEGQRNVYPEIYVDYSKILIGNIDQESNNETEEEIIEQQD